MNAAEAITVVSEIMVIATKAIQLATEANSIILAAQQQGRDVTNDELNEIMRRRHSAENELLAKLDAAAKATEPTQASLQPAEAPQEPAQPTGS